MLKTGCNISTHIRQAHCCVPVVQGHAPAGYGPLLVDTRIHLSTPKLGKMYINRVYAELS